MWTEQTAAVSWSCSLRLAGRAAVAALVLFAGMPASAHDRIPGTAQTRPVLLRGGDLYTVDQGVLVATDLLFADGKISVIGKNLVAPADAEVVDVAGQRVYPGLIAANTVVGLVEVGAVRATRDQQETGEVRPEVVAHVAYNPDSEIIPTLRNHGIAAVQVAPRGGLLAGRSSLLATDGWSKEDAALRLVDGVWMTWPDLAGGRPGETPRDAERRTERQASELRSLERSFAAARSYAAVTAGAAGPGKPPASDQRWEAMRPLFAGEIPLYVEADRAEQILAAVEFAAAQGVRLVIVGGNEADLVADVLAAPPQSTSRSSASGSDANLPPPSLVTDAVAADRRAVVGGAIPVLLGNVLAMPASDDDAYDQAFTRPARLAAAGVPFCLTVDGSWEVRNLPFAAGHAVAFGLDQATALRAVTLSCAEILGVAERMGSLTVGKDATLFVSAGDVLDTLGQKVSQMWIAGRAVDLDDRQRALWRKYQQKPRP